MVPVCLQDALTVPTATREKPKAVAGKNAYRLTEDFTQTKIAIIGKSSSEQLGPPLSLAEVRHLLRGLDQAEEQRARIVWWSRFQRTHQARTRVCHQQRRARQAPPVAPINTLPHPIFLPSLPQLTDALWEQLCPLFELAQSKRGRRTKAWRLRVEAVL